MENTGQSKKPLIIIIIVLILISAFVGYKLYFSNSKIETNITKKKTIKDEPIPTLDSSVLVDFKKEESGKSAILSIENIPDGTDTIEYELSYQTQEQGLQGIIGKIVLRENQPKGYEKEITLGTCSSGRCVYHKIVGKIKLLLRFNGIYGERIFEKEYEI